MAKKEMKKISEKREPNKTKSAKTDSAQRILIENFVSLQGVMADLSSKLNNLSDQMSKLLGLFEESAKTFMEKDIKIMGGGVDKNVSEKLDQLLDQNKVLARGIALLHEANQPEQSSPEQQMPPPAPQQPQFTQQMKQQQNPGNVNRYQKSLPTKY